MYLEFDEHIMKFVFIIYVRIINTRIHIHIHAHFDYVFFISQKIVIKLNKD
jgi:hypothetical protein